MEVLRIFGEGVEGLLQYAIGVPVAVLVDAVVATWRHQIDFGAIVGVRRSGLVVANGAHGDAVRVDRRVVDRRVIIACSRNDRDSAAVGVVHGVLQGRRGIGAPQAEIDDLGSVIGSPHDSVNDIAVGSVPIAVQHLDGHDVGVVGDACHSQAVVGGLGDSACHVGAMAVVIVGMAIVIDEVPSGNEGGCGQIWRLPVDTSKILIGNTGVDHGHYDSCPGGYIPGLLHLNQREVPLVGVVRVIRNKVRVPEEVGRGRLNGRIAHQLRCHMANVPRSVECDQRVVRKQQ